MAKIPYDLTDQGGKPTGFSPDDPEVIMSDEEFWIDAQDQVWRVTDMSTKHLENVIAYLTRNAEPIQTRDYFSTAAFAASFNPDGMAAYYADQELDRIISGSPEEYVQSLPIVEDMQAELDRRKGA